jgi:hypothetical protein
MGTPINRRSLLSAVGAGAVAAVAPDIQAQAATGQPPNPGPVVRLIARNIASTLSHASPCKACEQIRDTLARGLTNRNDGPFAGRAADSIRLAGGRVVSGSDSISLEDAFNQAGVSAVEEYADMRRGGASASCRSGWKNCWFDFLRMIA